MFELKIIKDNSGTLEIEKFDNVLEEIKKNLSTYYVFVAQNKEDYKSIKETRAELNSMAKQINDIKIANVKDLTETITYQCKTICDLIKEKSNEFDNEAKLYEEKVLNKEQKEKTICQFIINAKNEEEREKITKLLKSKKIDFTIKEK